ncbi:hypothetical protein [Corallococcus sp. CA054B]|nr:hypothetical protein [Corallococcus sp. CA054B]
MSRLRSSSRSAMAAKCAEFAQVFAQVRLAVYSALRGASVNIVWMRSGSA